MLRRNVRRSRSSLRRPLSLELLEARQLLSGSPPVAWDDVALVDETSFVEINVLENDSDADSDPLFVLDLDISETRGYVTVNGDGLLSYDPGGQFEDLAVGETETDSFSYTITDGVDGTATAWVTVIIQGVNGVPAAADDAAETDQDTATMIDVLANDSDPDGDALWIDSVDDASALGAFLEIFDDGQVYYDPSGLEVFQSLGEGETLVDTFEYTVADESGDTDTALVTVIVHGVNDDPWAFDLEGLLDEDGGVFVEAPGLLAGAGDLDAHDVLVVAEVDDWDLAGTLTWNEDGSFTYDPDGQFDWLAEGELAYESFWFTVSDGHGGTATAMATGTIVGVNDVPIATDDEAEVDEEGAITIGVLDNDSDVDAGDFLSVLSVNTQDTLGVVTLNDDGTIEYDPAGAFNGLGADATAQDVFSYTIDDGHGGTATATVVVTIYGENDDPIAFDDMGEVGEDAPVTIAAPGLLENDFDPDEGDILEILDIDTSETIGLVTWNADGSFTYDPDGQFEWLSLGDTAEDGFAYLVGDGRGGTAEAWAIGVIVGANDAPIAGDDEADTYSDEAFWIDVLENDEDVDESDELFVFDVQATSDQGAAVAITEDGQIEYDPSASPALRSLAEGETVEDYFTYTVSDEHGAMATATVLVVVTGVNDPPMAVDDAVSTDQATRVAINVLANDLDSDTEGSQLRVAGVSVRGTLGRVTVNGNGRFTYDPNHRFDFLAAGQTATDRFVYTVTDRLGGYDQAEVVVTIVGTNDPLTAWADEAATDEDEAVAIDVLANDADIDLADVLTISDFDATSEGGAAVTLNDDGTLTYDPTGRFDWLGVDQSTTDTFSYAATDGHGSVVVASVTVTIFGANDDPVAVDDEGCATDEDTAVWIDLADLLDNDDDLEGDAIALIGIDTEETLGSLSWIDEGLFYDPSGWFDELAAGDTAVDTFLYTISDGAGDTATARVTIEITGVNDSPQAEDDEAFAFEDGAVAIQVLENDSDVDLGDFLTVVELDTEDTAGLVTLQADGTILYDPAGQFDWLAEGDEADDGFAYTVADPFGGTATAWVTVTIVGGNDAPEAGDDAYAIGEDSLLEVTEWEAGLLANDADADGDELFIIDADATSAAGTAVEVFEDGTFTYDPRESSMLQRLGAGATWEDAFEYWISDDDSTAAGTVRITVTGVNDVPVAVGESITVDQDGTAWINVLANDSDIDAGDTISVASLDATGWMGLVTISPLGILTYNPNGRFDHLGPGETATDEIGYTIRDQHNARASATLLVTIRGTNHAPTARNDFDEAGSLHEDEPVTLPVSILLENDSDPDSGDTLEVIAVDASGAVGQVTLHDDGTFTYDPQGQYEWLAEGESATDSFWYTIRDNHGQTATALATGVIVGANDNPWWVRLDTSADVVAEGESLVLSGAFDDPDGNDWHTVLVDWGDGTDSFAEVDPVTRTFTASHWYADDNPSETPSDWHQIGVTVIDNQGAPATTWTEVLVYDVSPWIELEFEEDLMYAAGEALTVGGWLFDPGDDAWSVMVDYGDGTEPEWVELNDDQSFQLSHTYQSAGFYELTLTATDDDGLWGAGSYLAVIYEPLGVVDFRQLAGLDLTGGPTLFSFEAAHTGLATLEASFDGDVEGAWILFAGEFDEEPMISSPAGDKQRLDVEVVQGETYLFGIFEIPGDSEDLEPLFFEGTLEHVDLTLANLVSYEDGIVKIYGTAEDDQLLVSQEEGGMVAINDIAYRPDEEAEVSVIRFMGGEGWDTAILGGSAGDDQLAMHPGSATLMRPGLTIAVTGTEAISAYGAGGNDTVRFYDSEGDDAFTSLPGEAEFSGPGFVNRAEDFAIVLASSRVGGADTATLHGSPGNDVLQSSPLSSRLISPNSTTRVEYFEKVFAQGESEGFDRAYLYDSEFDDHLEADAEGVSLSSSGPVDYFYQALGFDSVRATRSTGNDTKSIATDVAFLQMLGGW